MKINWSISLKSIPELSDLPKKEQKNLWRQCYKMGFRHWQTWFAFVGCVLWSTLIGFIRLSILDFFPGLNKHIINILGGILGMGLGMYFFYIVLISVVRPYIKAKRNVIDR